MKETKQKPMTLLLLGHLNIWCCIFQDPSCGFGTNISKIVNARKLSFPGATCKDKKSHEKCFFLLLFTFEGSIAFRRPGPKVQRDTFVLRATHPGRTSSEASSSPASHHSPFPISVWSAACTCSPVRDDSLLPHQEVMEMGWENLKMAPLFLTRRSHTNPRSDHEG